MSPKKLSSQKKSDQSKKLEKKPQHDSRLECTHGGFFRDVYGDNYPIWHCDDLEVISTKKPTTRKEAESFLKQFRKKLISQIIGVKCLACMNREKFASQLGVSPEELAAIERGEKMPSQELVDEVRKVYKKFSTF